MAFATLEQNSKIVVRSTKVLIKSFSGKARHVESRTSTDCVQIVPFHQTKVLHWVLARLYNAAALNLRGSVKTAACALHTYPWGWTNPTPECHCTYHAPTIVRNVLDSTSFLVLLYFRNVSTVAAKFGRKHTIQICGKLMDQNAYRRSIRHFLRGNDHLRFCDIS